MGLSITFGRGTTLGFGRRYKEDRVTAAKWIERVKEILRQYEEGAVTDREAFRAIIFYAHGVEVPVTLEQED